MGAEAYGAAPQSGDQAALDVEDAQGDVSLRAQGAGDGVVDERAAMKGIGMVLSERQGQCGEAALTAAGVDGGQGREGGVVDLKDAPSIEGVRMIELGAGGMD